MSATTETEPVNSTFEKASENTSVQNLTDLSNFQLNRILSVDSRSKTICAVGGFSNKEGQAILYLEKTPLDEDELKSLCSGSTLMKQSFQNDIYGSYQCFPEQGLNSLKALVIHPATDKHISKYEHQAVHFVDETPELYQTVTLPHLEQEQFKLDWVFNVLDHKAEVERIVAEDPDPQIGFVLSPDLKWDCIDLKSLYLLALARPAGIKSLRDLTAEHLPLLENILKKGTEAITAKYGLSSSQLRIFVHYQPSFYHLHVHFTYLLYDAPGVNCGRAHLLSSIINNIKMMSDYYQKATLPFTLSEGYNLFTRYCEKGILQPVPIPDEPAKAEEVTSSEMGVQ